MNVIEPCPSVEELEKEIHAHFDKEIAEHGERAKALLAKLEEKGVFVTLHSESSWSSYSSELFGVKVVQRKLDRQGWEIRYKDSLQLPKWLGTLNEALSWLEELHLPTIDWGFFDTAYDNRIQKIRHELGKVNGTMTIATTGVVEPAAWILQVFENGKSLGDPVVSKGFDKLSQLLAFMEERLKIK